MALALVDHDHEGVWFSWSCRPAAISAATVSSRCASFCTRLRTLVHDAGGQYLGHLRADIAGCGPNGLRAEDLVDHDVVVSQLAGGVGVARGELRVWWIAKGKSRWISLTLPVLRIGDEAGHRLQEDGGAVRALVIGEEFAR